MASKTFLEIPSHRSSKKQRTLFFRGGGRILILQSKEFLQKYQNSHKRSFTKLPAPNLQVRPTTVVPSDRGNCPDLIGPHLLTTKWVVYYSRDHHKLRRREGGKKTVSLPSSLELPQTICLRFTILSRRRGGRGGLGEGRYFTRLLPFFVKCEIICPPRAEMASCWQTS